MIPLQDLNPQSVDVDIVLADKSTLTVTLRPYTMADHAWFQKEFATEDEAAAIAAMHIDAIAKLAWQMFTPESQAYFSNVKYRKFDEHLEKEIDVDVRGHEKLLHAVHGEESFWALMDAFVKCKGENGFMDADKIGVKKKTTKKQKKRSIGLNPLTFLHRNTDTRPNKYSR